MSTTTVTPKEPSMEELRAQAIAAQNAPPEAPAAPPPPPDPNEPYTITEGENGQVELKLRTGEVFKGTPLEVAKLAAKAKVDTTDYSKDLKAELTALKASTQHIQDALTPKPPAPSQEELQAKELQQFLLEQHAKGLGYSSADEFKEELIGIRKTSDQSRSDRIAMDFMAECPEFPATKENSDKLLNTAAEYQIIQVDAKGNVVREPTAKQLTAAHALCVQLGIYQPLTEAEIQQQINAGMRVKPKMQTRPTPPPMVPGTQPETTNNQETDPWKIPLADLRERAMGR